MVSFSLLASWDNSLNSSATARVVRRKPATLSHQVIVHNSIGDAVLNISRRVARLFSGGGAVIHLLSKLVRLELDQRIDTGGGHADAEELAIEKLANVRGPGVPRGHNAREFQL